MSAVSVPHMAPGGAALHRVAFRMQRTVHAAGMQHIAAHTAVHSRGGRHMAAGRHIAAALGASHTEEEDACPDIHQGHPGC